MATKTRSNYVQFPNDTSNDDKKYEYKVLKGSSVPNKINTDTKQKNSIYMTANKTRKRDIYAVNVDTEKLKEQEIINSIRKRLGR